MNTIKGIGIMALVFVLVVFAAVKDPFHLNPDGINGTGLGPVVYGLIGIGLVYLIYRYSNRKK